mmetsp:Transcript_19241/g.31595  ORF Transcript_19241/g.31595 Transcript_19241/m.31595 type:complete len:247 (-) Transcript_19241:52-792(-)
MLPICAVPILFVTPPFSIMPSAPTITKSTFSITTPTAASITSLTGIPISDSWRTISYPAPSGLPSVTITSKCLPSSEAALSIDTTLREVPWTKTVFPEPTNFLPNEATRSRLLARRLESSSPRLTRTSLMPSKSAEVSISLETLVTVRRKKSQAEHTGMDTCILEDLRTYILISFAASCSSSPRPIIVVDSLLRSTSASVRIAPMLPASSLQCDKNVSNAVDIVQSQTHQYEDHDLECYNHLNPIC